MARAAVVAAAGLGLALAPAAQAAPSATLEVVHPGRNIETASTFTPGSFVLTNTSDEGEAIVAFSIDLANGPALFPNLVFDPLGGAGDAMPKPFTQDSGTSAGILAVGSHPEDSANDGGFEVLSVTIPSNNFEPSTVLSFSIDIDPTSTKGITVKVPTPHQASVSGAEAHGAKVTVSFSDGSSLVNDLVRVSDTDATAVLKQPGLAAPGLSRPRGAMSPAVTGNAQHEVVVSGPAGESGIVVVAEGHLDVTDAPGGFEGIDPFEANTVVGFAEVPFTIPDTGEAVVPVTLTNTPTTKTADAATIRTGYNYITAYLTDGTPGRLSGPIVLRLDPSHVAETEPPGIVGVAPADGATGVPRDADVTVTFDEPMDPGTVSFPGAFTLVDASGATVPATVTADPAGITFTLDPAPTLDAGKRHTAKVTTNPTDLAGNPLPAARTWSFTTGKASGGTTPTTPDPPSPPDDPNAPWCATVPARPTNDEKGAIRLEASQLLISQRIAQAAVRRANAIEAWLAEGIVADDLCGNALGAADFGPGVSLAAGPSPTAITVADPRPIRVAAGRDGGSAAKVSLDAGQLLINQRISQAAVRRVNALARRLDAGLTGGDVRDGAITGAKLARDLVVQSAADGAPTPPSRTQVGGRTGGGGRVTVSVRQLQINQRISQAAVRRVNALADRLMRGLTGSAFRDGTIGAAKLAPELRNGAPPA